MGGGCLGIRAPGLHQARPSLRMELALLTGDWGSGVERRAVPLGSMLPCLTLSSHPLWEALGTDRGCSSLGGAAEGTGTGLRCLSLELQAT